MERAVEKVRQRLLRAAAALEGAGVPYAIAGGNAVALWVSRVDEAAVRNTRDVDVLIRRGDFPAARAALEAAGFVYRHARGIDLFLDGPSASAREAVHVIFAREKVREHEPAGNPDVTESEQADRFRVLSLEAVVRMELAGGRDENGMHLCDLVHVGLLDETSLPRLPPLLAERLKQFLDDPNG